MAHAITRHRERRIAPIRIEAVGTAGTGAAGMTTVAAGADVTVAMIIGDVAMMDVVMTDGAVIADGSAAKSGALSAAFFVPAITLIL
jgi:hypothetical protein